MGEGNGRVTVDDWELISAARDFATLAMEDLSAVLSRGEVERNDETAPYHHISIRLIQPTLCLELDRLRRMYRLSTTCIQRLTTMHGIAVIRDATSYSVLQETIGVWQDRMHNEYSNDQVGAITAKGVLSLTDVTLRPASFSLYNWVHGAILDFASDASLQLQHAVQFCALASFLTFPEPGAYRVIGKRDMERLEEHLQRHTTLISA